MLSGLIAKDKLSSTWTI